MLTVMNEEYVALCCMSQCFNHRPIPSRGWGLHKRNNGSGEYNKPSQNKRAKSRSTEGIDIDEEERTKMYHKLHSLMDKYKEMAKRMGALSSIDQLLTSIFLPYSVEVMTSSLPLKFKIP